MYSDLNVLFLCPKDHERFRSVVYLHHLQMLARIGVFCHIQDMINTEDVSFARAKWTGIILSTARLNILSHKGWTNQVISWNGIKHAQCLRILRLDNYSCADEISSYAHNHIFVMHSRQIPANIKRYYFGKMLIIERTDKSYA